MQSTRELTAAEAPQRGYQDSMEFTGPPLPEWKVVVERMNCSSAEELEQYLARQEAAGHWLVQAVEQDSEVWLVFACSPQEGEPSDASPPPPSAASIISDTLKSAADR